MFESLYFTNSITICKVDLTHSKNIPQNFYVGQTFLSV
jgi:hypothetical protein